MADYLPGKRLQWYPGDIDRGTVEVVHGPVQRDGDMGYLVKHVDGYSAGQHRLVGALTLRQLAKVGDDGHLSGYRFKWRIHHIDDEVVTLQAIGSTYGSSRWRAESRKYFDNIWRLES